MNSDYKGENVMSPALMESGSLVEDQFLEATVLLERDYHLTPREAELVKTVSLYGCNNKELSVMLQISEKTVKNHLANIMKKTKTKSCRELLALIVRASLKRNAS
jgi:DNA-binding CsgD family transcriptional regulator